MSDAPIPAVTADQMRTIDRIATQELGLDILQMMENAGRALATFVARRVPTGRVLCLAGKGGNGGGGLAAVRHLENWGFDVAATVVDEALSDATNRQRGILERSGLAVGGVPDLAEIDPKDVAAVVDAVIGYGLADDPRGDAAALISFANRCPFRVSLDVPSGLEATTGRARRPCVRTHATVTLALPKKGLLRPEAGPYVGELWLADVGIPPAVYARLGLPVSRPFSPGEILRKL
jgi:NAD(P)H-hydrate epimerase